MTFDWVSHGIAFLLGTGTGAAGKYLADTFTDRRRNAASRRRLKQDFLSVKQQMPGLIEEMKADLSKEGQKLIREFFVLPNRGACLGGSEKPRLIYYEEEHSDLRCKFDLLESKGFLLDVTTGNTPLYRMTEQFVELLARYG